MRTILTWHYRRRVSAHPKEVDDEIGHLVRVRREHNGVQAFEQFPPLSIQKVAIYLRREFAREQSAEAAAEGEKREQRSKRETLNVLVRLAEWGGPIMSPFRSTASREDQVPIRSFWRTSLLVYGTFLGFDL